MLYLSMAIVRVKYSICRVNAGANCPVMDRRFCVIVLVIFAPHSNPEICSVPVLKFYFVESGTDPVSLLIWLLFFSLGGPSSKKPES